MKRHLLEAAGLSSWSLPGHKKGCDLSVLCAKAVGVFPGVCFLKSKLYCREKFWATQLGRKKTHNIMSSSQRCAENVEPAARCVAACQACDLWEEKQRVAPRVVSYQQVSTSWQFISRLAKEGPSPWLSSHNCLCHKCVGPPRTRCTASTIAGGILTRLGLLTKWKHVYSNPRHSCS